MNLKCKECGFSTKKWLPACPDCRAWGCFELPGVFNIPRKTLKPVLIQQIATNNQNRHKPTGIISLDKVLGGGLVPGGVYVLSGAPGVGKSTLSLQLLARRPPAAYISGEETLEQIRMRQLRLAPQIDQLWVYQETLVEHMEQALRKLKPALFLVDSIQTCVTLSSDRPAGSPTQITKSSSTLTQLAKSTNTSCFLISHETKSGRLHGPRILEHLVDVVLRFTLEGSDRILRCSKNRYGPANVEGLFTMTERGLESVLD